MVQQFAPAQCSMSIGKGRGDWLRGATRFIAKKPSGRMDMAYQQLRLMWLTNSTWNTDSQIFSRMIVRGTNPYPEDV